MFPSLGSLFPEPYASILYGGGWCIRILALFWIPFGRSPAAARAWLLLVFFEPWFGMLFFLFLGSAWRSKLRSRRYKRLSESYRKIISQLREDKDIEHPAVPPEYENVVCLAERLGQFPIVGGNKVDLLPEYDALFSELAKEIDGAKETVHMLYFILADDEKTRPVWDAMARAARRGVECRVLADALGSRHGFTKLKKKLAASGVRMRRALPVQLDKLFGTRPDLRNHRKIVVIDGRVGFTGSQNLVRRDYQPPLVFEDITVRCEGPVVQTLQAAFFSDWFLETGTLLDLTRCFPNPTRAGDVRAQLVPSRPEAATLSCERLIVSLLHAARERVIIVTPYFIPDEPVLHAIESAAARGVDVKLVIPKQQDGWAVGQAQRSFFDELFGCNVKVYLYGHRFLHSKFLIIDDEISLVGSNNMDIRSFQLNAEASLVVYDKAFALRMHKEEERILAHAEKVDPKVWAQRSRMRKLGQNIARMFSPVL